MRRFTNPLDNIRVASPCSSKWDEMLGDERVRFCGKCELNVFNLSAMSRREAESSIARAEGRLCVRFYRRRDGSILTEDCPVGLRALKERASRIRSAVASSVLGFLAAAGVHLSICRFATVQFVRQPLMGSIAVRRDPIPPVQPTLITPLPVMGKMIDRKRRK